MAVYLSPVGLSTAQVPNRVSLLATYKERLCRRICENSTNQPEAFVTYKTGTPIFNGTTVFVPVIATVTIVKHHTCDHDKEHEDEEDVVVESRIATPHGEHKVKFDLPYEQTANALMSAKGYSEYVKKHGYHFTDALAEHVSKMMVNANGQQHSWTASQVKKSMESLGLSIPGKVTTGDVTYAANMAYADFYPDPLKDEAACLRYAHKVANDPDGYDGMIFCRWTADAIGKAIKLDWEKFV